MADGVPAADANDDAIQAFLVHRRVVIFNHDVIETTRKCLRRQALDYAGKGGN